MFLGEIWRYRVQLDPPEAGAELELLAVEPLAAQPGEPVELFVRPDQVVLLPAGSAELIGGDE